MSTPGLTAVASFVLRSLRDHPERSLPDAIAAEAAPEDRYDEESIHGALRELQQRGLAEEVPGSGWRLTDAATASG
jgi:hypothetical protein